MTDDSLLPFELPAVQRKKVSAAFDGCLISSDGGLVLLREAERLLSLEETLAGCIRDRRNQARVVHALLTMLHFRMLATACGRKRNPPRRWPLMRTGEPHRVCIPDALFA